MGKDLIFNILDFQSYHNEENDSSESDVDVDDNSTNTGSSWLTGWGRPTALSCWCQR